MMALSTSLSPLKTVKKSQFAWCGLLVGLTVGVLSSPAFAAEPSDRAGVEFFEKHIRPVLVAHCYNCHSAGAEKLKGGLLLDTRDGLLKGGDNGPAIVAGDPEKSLLIKAVRYADENLLVPTS